jgi:hypothetical protein
MYGTTAKEMAECDMWVSNRLHCYKLGTQHLLSADGTAGGSAASAVECGLHEGTSHWLPSNDYRRVCKVVTRLQDCSAFKEAQLKDKFLRGYLASALEGICRVMAKNRTMYLVGDKVHCSPRAACHPGLLMCVSPGHQLTFVDTMLFSLLEAIDRELPQALATFPLLIYFRDTIKRLPRIAAFCNSGRRF